MKKYYILTRNNQFVLLGEFDDFHKAYEYADENKNFYWIFDESDLTDLYYNIEKIITK